jgi:DNA-directed RNA polymerase specialized sigma24 family protein
MESDHEKQTVIESLRRIEGLLKALVTEAISHRSAQVEKALVLSRAGLSHGEIADLLGTTTPVITQQLYLARKGRAPRKVKVTKKVGN